MIIEILERDSMNSPTRPASFFPFDTLRSLMDALYAKNMEPAGIVLIATTFSETVDYYTAKITSPSGAISHAHQTDLGWQIR